MRQVLVALVLSALLVGCGSRPSEDEIAQALRDPSNTISIAGYTTDEETIDCIAEAMHDSDVSDEALQAVVDNDPEWQGDGESRDVLADLTGAVTACVVRYAPGVAS